MEGKSGKGEMETAFFSRRFVFKEEGKKKGSSWNRVGPQVRGAVASGGRHAGESESAEREMVKI